jgi:biotin carboxylase
MSGKRVLLFASKLGYQTRAFGAAAEHLGVELVFVTDRCHQLNDPWNDKAISAHFEVPNEAAFDVVQSQRALGVDGILAVGDRPGVTAALVARGLGILYNHPISVEACRSKLRMREVFRDAGLPVPWFRSVALQPPPEPALLGITYPCVLKPLSLSASQGVVRVNNREEFVATAVRLKRLLESPEIQSLREPNLDQMLVEGYMPGKEVAVEGLLTAGTLRSLAIFDKPDPLEGPYFEETIYVTPSRLTEAEQRAIERSMISVIGAIGLSQGPVHAEFRINETGVWCLEVAPRPIGGLCARALRFDLASEQRMIGLEELLLRHALGLPGSDALREEDASGVMMIPVPRSGMFEGVRGEEDARKTSGVTDIEITARIHDYVAAWPEGSSYLGFIFARAAAPRVAEEALRRALAKLQFQIVPRIPVEHPVTKKFSPGETS